jgi:hypothetical protein
VPSDRKTVESIKQVLDAANEKGHKPVTAEIGKVPAWLVREAKQAGLDVDGFTHTIDADAVRHMRGKHGDEGTESARGQIAVTDADIARIPEIIAAPDRILFGARTKQGRDIVAYTKRLEDGSTLYLEEVREGRQRLAAVSMRRYPATIDADSIAAGLNPYVRRSEPAPLGGDGLKVVDRPARASGEMEGLAREHEAADDAVKQAESVKSCLNGGGGEGGNC